MDGGSSEGSEARFAAYIEALGAVLRLLATEPPQVSLRCLSDRRSSSEGGRSASQGSAGNLRQSKVRQGHDSQHGSQSDQSVEEEARPRGRVRLPHARTAARTAPLAVTVG